MERMEQKIKRLIRVAGKRTTAVVLALLMVVSMLPVVWPSVSAADYVCGLEEHTHSEECAEAACEKAEHAHTDGCYPAEEPDSEVTERVEAEKNIPVIPVSGSDAKDAVVSAGDVSGSDVSGSDIDLIEAFPVFAQSAAVDGVVVSVSAPIGVFPAGAELSVSKVSASTQSQVDALIGEADDSYTFDIKVLLDGEEIQPDTAYGEVSVRFSLDVPANTEVEVYHIDDGMTEADAMAPVVGDNSVAVVTDSFSVFTVTFTYNGLTYALDYEIGGANTVKLSEMLTALGISGTPSAAVSGNAAVTAVEDGSGDWDITIAKPFDTAITLTATVDGTDYEIELTSNVAHTGTCNGCSWIIDAEGVLTIYPANGVSGKLISATSAAQWPWYAHRTAIKKVVVEDGVSSGESCAGMFMGMTNCIEMDLSGLDTSATKKMNSMFRDNHMTTVIFGDGFDTSNVTDMRQMFYGCYNLAALDVSSFDTSNVTNMKEMFRNCQKLAALDVSGFDTSNVTDMSSMFSSCNALVSVGDVGGWDTSNVTDMFGMFSSCNALVSVGDVGGWDTSNVTDMGSMFSDCFVLSSLNVTDWDTSNVTAMHSMFAKCRKLAALDVSGFDTSNVTNMSNMFLDCQILTTIDVSGFDTSNVTNMTGMFSKCSAVQKLDVTGFDTSNVTNMSYMFSECETLTDLDVSNFDTSNVTDMSYMFYLCTVLPTIDVANFNTSNVTKMNYMFYLCEKVAELDLSRWDTSNVTDMSNMFYGDKTLDTISVSAKFSPATNYEAEYNVNFFNVVDGTLIYTPKNRCAIKSLTVDGQPVEFDALGGTYAGFTGDSVAVIEYAPAMTVTFMDGETEVEKQVVAQGNDAKDPYKDNVPVVPGMRYLGWDKAFTNVQSDLTVNALWEPDEYTLTFDVNGGDALAADKQTKTVTYTLPVGELPAATRTGYTFDGWFDGNGTKYTADTVYNVQADTTLTAQWTINEYDITYNVVGEKPNKAVVPANATVEHGDAYAAVIPTAISGYTFDGWYTDESCTTKFADNTVITEDTTLYGKWTVEQYTVTFKDSTDNSTIGEVTVDSNTAATAPAAPTHEDLEFVRWATEKNGETEADLTAVTEDMTVWAVYKEPRDSITGAPSVVFDKASKTFTTKEEIKFKAVGFWADSTTTDFIDGDERYVPLNWHHADPSGDFGGKTAPTDTYTGSFKQSSAGTYTLKVEFRKYVYEDGAWVDKGIVTVDTQYKVTAPSGGSTIVPDTGDHGVSGTVALYVMQIAILSALLCVFSAKKLRKTGEAE